MKLEKPKAILFDWDNTLINTWPRIYRAMHETFIHMGKKPWTYKETKLKVSHSVKDAFPKLFGDRHKEAAEIYIGTYQKISNNIKSDQLYDGVIETLDLIKNKGIYSAVVSNKTAHILHKEVEQLGLKHYFKKVVGAAEAPQDKPHPDPAYFALDGSGIEPGMHVWFIGDTFSDTECALNAGLTSILYGEYNPNVIPREPHKVIKSQKEIQELIIESGY